MKRVSLIILLSTFPFILIAQKLKSVIKRFPHSESTEVEYSVLGKNNWKHGVYIEYFQNGQIKEIGVYFNNYMDEEWREFNHLGELRRVRKFEKGRILSDKKYGIWKRVGSNGKQYFYDYTNDRRAMPPLVIRFGYPSTAREDGIAGLVKVKVLLDEKCEIKELAVVQSLRADFDEAVIRGLRDFIQRFQYYDEDCKNYENIFTINFSLE